MNHKSLSWLFLGGALALAGCSGLNLPSSTAATSVSLASTVGGSSSLLLVNGQPLDLSAASITVDDAPGQASDVKPGMEISGDGQTDDKGKLKMKHIEVRWRMKGTIDAVDGTNSSLDVVGLRAKVDTSTLIFKVNTDGTETAVAFADLKQGDYIKLAGLPQADDSVLATRIEVKTPSDATATDFRVLARKLDGTTKTFTYGLQTITVDFGSATLAGTPAEGKPVRVKGTRSGNKVTAQLVQGTDPTVPGINNHDQRLELRGPLSSLNATDKTFVLRGFTVNYASATVDGTLAENAVVEVRGKITGDKTADAVQVHVEDGTEHSKPAPTPPLAPLGRIEGPVMAFDAANKTLNIFNVAVSVSATTKYEVADKDVSADVFWGTNREGSRARAEGKVSNTGLIADKLEIR